MRLIGSRIMINGDGEILVYRHCDRSMFNPFGTFNYQGGDASFLFALSTEEDIWESQFADLKYSSIRRVTG